MSETPHIPMTILRNRFGQYMANVCNGTRLVITSSGVPIGAVVSIEDFKTLEGLGKPCAPDDLAGGPQRPADGSKPIPGTMGGYWKDA